MNPFRQSLIDRFRDAEYREAYAEDFANTAIATQIAILREQRGLKQKELAAKLGVGGTKQPRISLIENVGYGRWTIRTLHEVARALGVRLRVSFESFGTLVDEAIQFSRESLQRPGFDDDPVFQEGATTKQEFSLPVIRWSPETMKDWLDERRWLNEHLSWWLLGYGMPVDRWRAEPFQKLAGAIKEMDAPGVTRYRSRLADRLAHLIDARGSIEMGPEDEGKLERAMYYLAALLEMPEVLGPSLKRVFNGLSPERPAMEEESRDALRAALARNQHDESRRDDWLSLIEKDEHPVLPGNAFDGWEGILRISPRPNWEAIREGLQGMQQLLWRLDDSVTPETSGDKLLSFQKEYARLVSEVNQQYPLQRDALIWFFLQPVNRGKKGNNQWARQVHVVMTVADNQFTGSELSAAQLDTLALFQPAPAVAAALLANDEKRKERYRSRIEAYA